jgi:hypothetical protein
MTISTISQVALSNTFNEFRQSFNDAANAINGAIVTGTENISANNIVATTIASDSIRGISLTNGRVALVGVNGIIGDDSGLLFDTAQNAVTVQGTLTSGNVSTGGTLGVTGISTLTGAVTHSTTTELTGNVTVNTNKLTITASNGTISGATANVYVGHVHANTRVHSGSQVASFLTEIASNEEKHTFIGVESSNDAIDVAVVNQNTGTLAYSEFIAMNNRGNTDSGWISMGINSSNYNDPAFQLTKKDDAYMLYEAPQGSTGTGDLVIATGEAGTSRKIIFGAGGFSTGNTQMQIEPDTRVYINIPTNSSSTTTGALVINGGLGLAGNLNVGGNVTITGAISLQGSGNTVSTSSLSVANSLLFLAANNNADILDFGVVGEYKLGATTKFAGFVRDASDGLYKLFANNSATPANTVNFSGTGSEFAGLVIGSANVSNTTASSSSTTGALRVAGGAGIAGKVYSGDYIFDSIGNLRTVPQNAQVGSYTLVAGDVGRHISTTAGVTVNISIFSAGDVVTIYNNSSSSITITLGTSVTLRLAGSATTGNRTLAQRGLVTLLCVAAGEFIASGSGVS